MKSTTIYKSLLALAAPLMLAACSNDSDTPDVPTNDEFEGIVLNIPNTRGGVTRASEVDINTMTVLAYSTKETDLTKRKPEVFEYSSTSLSTDNYTQLPVRLKADTYHVYVLANIAVGNLKCGNSLHTAWENMTESDLQQAVLTETEPLMPDSYLPMTCNYLAMRSTPSTKDGSGNWTYGNVYSGGNIAIGKGETKTVYADLTYAVAKVRYTMLNNNTSTLKMADSDKIKIHNYATEISAMDHLSTFDVTPANSKAVTGGKFYACPSYSTEEQGKAVNPDNVAGDELSDVGNTWAYQGVVYVPERLFSGDTNNYSNKTTLQFCFNQQAYTDQANFEFGKKGTEVFGPNNGTESETLNGIVRGVYYDVVAFTLSKTVVVEVRVKPWTYHKTVYDLDDNGNVTEK
ncbi:MAG: hypothetical protein K2K58_07000 [Muribaculaceae bacterium]|nr:hypothetical protein [Muribaculaceae bacterium]